MKKRNTVQKNLVLDTVRSMANHPTADEVYDTIHIFNPSISRTTIYRNLNSLVEDKVLKKISVSDSADRFDHNLHDHYHVKCLACGAFIDTELPEMDRIYETIERINGYKVEKCGIVFRGECPSCRKRILSA